MSNINIQTFSGKVNISDTLTVNGNIYATYIHGNGSNLANINASSIDGTLSQWTGDVGDSIYYESNVGIGTTDPQYTLDVHGTANVGVLTATYIYGDGSNIENIVSSQWEGTPGNPIYYDNNVGSMRLMLDFARSHGIKKVLYASSSNAAEWWTNPYGTTKKMNEIQAEPYSAIGMRFHTIWPGRPDMLYAKLKKGEVTYINAGHYRDMIHVEDVSSAIQVLLENFYHLLPHKVVDIGTGQTESVVDIAEAYGYTGAYRTYNPDGERVVTQANIEWLTDLQWAPKWNILKDSVQE